MTGRGIARVSCREESGFLLGLVGCSAAFLRLWVLGSVVLGMVAFLELFETSSSHELSVSELLALLVALSWLRGALLLPAVVVPPVCSNSVVIKSVGTKEKLNNALSINEG